MGTLRHTGDADGNGGPIHGHRNVNAADLLVVGIFGRVGGIEGVLAHIANTLLRILPSPLIGGQRHLGKGVAVDSRHIVGDGVLQKGLTNGILHTGGYCIIALAQRDAGFVFARVGGGGSKGSVSILILVGDGDLSHRQTLPVVSCQRRRLGLSVIVEADEVEGLDGHAAAVFVGAVCGIAGSNNGVLGTLLELIRPVVLVRAEVELIILAFDDHIALVRLIRDEDGGIVQRRIGRVGGELSLEVLHRLIRRGDADAGIICQTRADGDVLFREQVHIVLCAAGIFSGFVVQCAALAVASDVHRAVEGKGCIGCPTHAAAVSGSIVAGDGAVFHVEGNIGDHTHAAGASIVAGDGAVLHGKCCLFIHEHAAAVVLGRVAGDAAAVHGEGAAVAHIHPAAGASIVAGDGAVLHGKCCIISHIHAAAIGGIVLGDGAAAHGECAAPRIAGHIHTAAVSSRVFGDGAVVHGERAAVAHTHAAAVADGLVAGDGAAVHCKGGAAPNTHTAATVRLCAVRRVAGDGAAVHIECAAHTHAAAAARYVVGDLAAVHIEYAAFADIHAAAGYSFSALIVAGDAAAVHIECAAHNHTGEVVRFIGLDIKAVGDLTLFSRRFAVGQGKGLSDFTMMVSTLAFAVML